MTNDTDTKMVTYDGTSDFYELGRADWKKAGLDFTRDISFPRGVPVEVPAQIADKLVGTEAEETIFFDHEFSIIETEELTPVEDPESEAVNTDNSNSAKTGTPQEGVDTASGTGGRRGSRAGTTGNGSSTGGGSSAGNGSST